MASGSRAEVRRKELQGDVSAEPLVERLVDDSHRPGAEGFENAVAADGLPLPPEQRCARLRDGRCEVDDQPVHQPRAVVRFEERFDFARSSASPRALPIEHRMQRPGIALDRGREDVLNTLPALGRHRCRPGGRRLTARSDRSRLKLPIQPGAGEGPVPLDRCRRDAERLGGLFDAHSAEEAALDDSRVALVHGRQALQRFVEREHVVCLLHDDGDRVRVERTGPSDRRRASAGGARRRSR